MFLFKKMPSYFVWPMLVCSFVASFVHLAKNINQPIFQAGGRESLPLIGLVILYIVVCVSLEYIMPYRSEWSPPLGRQEVRDVGHYFLGIVPAEMLGKIFTYALISALWAYLPSLNHNLWPSSWPFSFQLVIAILLADFTCYFFHRSCHQFAWLWRCHEFHHTMEKVTLMEGLRHNAPEWLLETIFLMAVIILAKIPESVLVWLAAIMIATNLLSHANINAKLPGLLKYLAINPEVHRIHHSPNPWPSNCNFGEVTYIPDLLFGTYLDPTQYQLNQVGIKGFEAPDSFIGQWLYFLNPKKYRVKKKNPLKLL